MAKYQNTIFNLCNIERKLNIRKLKLNEYMLGKVTLGRLEKLAIKKLIIKESNKLIDYLEIEDKQKAI